MTGLAPAPIPPPNFPVSATAVAAEYLPILLFLGVALVLALAFVGLPMLIARLAGTHQPYGDKLTEYESGFPAFSSSRGRFDVRFYLVAILFIIFDLEVAFLFPWAVGLAHMGPDLLLGWVSMVVFLGILTVGFIYEWKKGALDWE